MPNRPEKPPAGIPKRVRHRAGGAFVRPLPGGAPGADGSTEGPGSSAVETPVQAPAALPPIAGHARAGDTRVCCQRARASLRTGSQFHLPAWTSDGVHSASGDSLVRWHMSRVGNRVGCEITFSGSRRYRNMTVSGQPMDTPVAPPTGFRAGPSAGSRYTAVLLVGGAASHTGRGLSDALDGPDGPADQGTLGAGTTGSGATWTSSSSTPSGGASWW